MAHTQAGTQQVATSASVAVGVSGKPVIVYGGCLVSDTTAAVLILKDGDNSGVEKARVNGTVSAGQTFSFGPYGKFFPNGAFAVADSHTTLADFDYVQVTI